MQVLEETNCQRFLRLIRDEDRERLEVGKMSTTSSSSSEDSAVALAAARRRASSSSEASSVASVKMSKLRQDTKESFSNEPVVSLQLDPAPSPK